MSFSNLIQITRPDDKKKLGCEFCPLNEIKGVNKVLGKVKGKRIFIWAQSPGMQENRDKKELIGPAGQFLWNELARVGIKRKKCDIQNVVRCVPVDVQENVYPPLRMRTPTKEEIKCCSLYNEQALSKSKARIHLVFGQIAAQSLLGKEYNKTKRIQFSEKLKTWVVCLDHPAYFIRMGYGGSSTQAPNDALKRFRKNLAHAKFLLKHKRYDQFQFLKDQNYIGVTNRKEAYKAYSKLKRAVRKGIRLVADMEEGKVDKHGKPDDNGKTVALCCGFTARPGTSYTFALHHPDSPASKRCRSINEKITRRLLRTNPVSFHYGAYDTDAIKRLLGATVNGFDYDTLIGEFFRDPNAKAYGLAAIAERRFPDFANYKDIRYPDAYTEDYRKKIEKQKLDPSKKMEKADKTGQMNLARLPWKKMVLYNGADCHLEKLVEESTEKYVNPPLMKVYVDAGHVLYRMQHDRDCLPVFDYEWYKQVRKLLKNREKNLRKKLQKLVGHKYITLRKWKKDKDGNEKAIKVKKKFNPGSPEQIYWLIYEKLKIKPLNDTPNTRAGTLNTIAINHPKAKIIVEHREVTKEISMMESYRNCADLNDGRLKTIWKLTGTSTGRLSSGKTKERTDDHVINFQNIHGDALIKCMFVSTTSWHRLYEYWLKHGSFDKRSWKKFEDIDVMLGYDFSQNELRQLAEESGDVELQKMFSSGADPHVEVGHAITGWSKKSIAKDDRVRKLVKNIQFGLVYNLQGPGLFSFLVAHGVKTKLSEVEKFHAAYFKRFPGVRKLQKRYANFAETHGYVQNVFGFRRKLNVAAQKEGEDYDGGYWKNQSVNTPIQGASHQLLLMALAALVRQYKKYQLLQKVMMEIHDSLFFRVKLKYLMKAIVLGKELMMDEPTRIVEHDFKLKKRVPLKAKPKAGFRFGVQIEDIDNMTEYEFLNAWCRENKKLQDSFEKQQMN